MLLFVSNPRSKAPATKRVSARAAAIRVSACRGSRVSAWRKRRISPRASEAPRFIWRARPGSESTRTIPSSRIACSVLPAGSPSTTMISTGLLCCRPRRWVITALMVPASCSTGRMIEMSALVFTIVPAYCPAAIHFDLISSTRFRFTPRSDFPKREADRILIDLVDSSRENSTSSTKRMMALVNSA